MNARVIWNGLDGEIDSINIFNYGEDTSAIRIALISLIKDHIVWPGDSFVIERLSDDDEPSQQGKIVKVIR